MRVYSRDSKRVHGCCWCLIEENVASKQSALHHMIVITSQPLEELKSVVTNKQLKT